MSKIGVIGSGAFGTALASVATLGGQDTVLWGRDGAQTTKMQTQRVNAKYLPDMQLPDGLAVTHDLARVLNCDIVLMVLPAQQLRGFLQENDLSRLAVPVALCAKGIEIETGLLQQEILYQFAPKVRSALISGPGFAQEMTQGKPTALSIACADEALGKMLQSALSSQILRLYLTQDMQGVALGGALKNVYAIACGLVVGSDLGESARAALMTRGFAEMARLATAKGAQMETLMGLSGFGDMALSCTSLQSRNFSFGEALARSGVFGQGKTVEGIATAQAVLSLAKAADVDMPIAAAVAAVLAGRLSVNDAVAGLMSRPLKREG